MKNVFIYGLVLSLIAVNSLAATTGTLLLSGTVAVNYELTVAAQTGHNALNILAGESNDLVGIVTEKTNNPTGYKIKMSSANAGLLKNGTIDSVSYTISYNGATAVTPSLTPTLVKTVNTAAPGGNLSNVSITFPAKPLALAGTYTDTLTFTIEAP